MYKCNHCNITFSGKDDEGILTFRGKMYCKKCEEPVVEIHDPSQTSGAIHVPRTTLISKSDNRITTNNYFGGGTYDDKIDTPYGSCNKNDARMCKNCRQWVPLLYYNVEQGICDNCAEQESFKALEEGQYLFEVGLISDALEIFLKHEIVCKNQETLSNLQYNIGRCYYEQSKWAESLKYFVKSKDNNPDSLFFLGLCLKYGQGTPADETRAKDIIKNAAHRGSKQASEFIEEEERLQNELQRKQLEKQRKREAEKKLYKKTENLKENDLKQRINGLQPFRNNGKMGYVNKSGKLVIPCIWASASFFDDGLAYVKDDNGKYGFINVDGELVIPCAWEYAYRFCNGFARVKDDRGYGFVNTDGNLVSPCIWEDAEDFYDGMACVKDNNGRYGFINMEGLLVVPCKWRFAYSFKNGLAHVLDDSGNHLYIDKTGIIVKK